MAGGVGRGGDGSEVVRLRWFDPRRFVHTQFARRFPGKQAPRALSVPVTKPAKHFRSPATTPTLHSLPQLQSHHFRNHVQSHPRPLHAANTHDGHAAHAHDGHAPEPATLHEADHGAAQACACTPPCISRTLVNGLLTICRRRSTAVSQSWPRPFNTSGLELTS